MPRKADLWRLPLALALLDFLVRFLLAIRPIEFIDGWTIPDDAYISLTIARSIASGLGPFFGLAHTNGFQPLYVFLMVPVFQLFPGNPETPIHAALILLSLCDAVALFLVCRVLLRTIRSHSALLFVGAVWIFNPTAIKHVVNGLETGLSLCSAAAILLALAHLESSRTPADERRRSLVFGILGGLAVLARIDNLLLIAAGMLVHATGSFALFGAGPGRGPDNTGRDPRGLAINIAVIAAGALAVSLPWWLYSLHYTGEILPISGRAVRYHSLSFVDHAPTFANCYYPNLKRSVTILLNGNRAAIAAGLILVVLILMRVGKRGSRAIGVALQPHRAIWIHVLFLLLAYSLYIFTPWYFPRYYLPALLAFALTLGSLADLFLGMMSSPRTRKIFVVVSVLLLAGVNIANREFRGFYTNKDSLTAGYMNLGLWAGSHFPDGTRVGSMQSGALGYFAPNLTTVNLDGVVNRDCYEALKRKEGMEYLRRERVEYFIAWLENFETLMKETRSFRDDDLILVNRLEGFGSWRHNWYLYRVNYRDGAP